MHKFILLIGLLLFLSGCKDEEDRSILRKVNYQFDFTMPAGLNNTQTHVFEFERINTRAEKLFEEVGKDNVNLIQVINAQVYPISGDGSIDIFSRLEIWCEIFEDPDEEYFDCAYTLNLPINNRDSYIQLIPTEQRFNDIFENKYFNLYIRTYLHGIPQRSQEYRLLLELAFYE